MNRNSSSTLSSQRPEALALARQGVRDLLMRSPAVQALPPEAQREIAYNTVQVAACLAAPEGSKATNLPSAQPASNDPYALQLADSAAPVPARRGPPREGEFVAQGAREGA